VAAFARVQLDDGRTPRSLARELGIHPGTLERWLEAEVSHGFLPVTVTAVPVLDAEPMAEPFAPPLPSALSQRVLISPAGYRLEGLTLDDVVHVLRELS